MLVYLECVSEIFFIQVLVGIARKHCRAFELIRRWSGDINAINARAIITRALTFSKLLATVPKFAVGVEIVNSDLPFRDSATKTTYKEGSIMIKRARSEGFAFLEHYSLSPTNRGQYLARLVERFSLIQLGSYETQAAAICYCGEQERRNSRAVDLLPSAQRPFGAALSGKVSTP
jgi:hypothetical protein